MKVEVDTAIALVQLEKEQLALEAARIKHVLELHNLRAELLRQGDGKEVLLVQRIDDQSSESS